MEMRDEVLLSVRAKDMDTSGYQVSNLEVIESQWEDPDLNMDAVFQPGIDTPFSPSYYNDIEMGSMAEIPFLADKEENKESSPTLPTTPMSDRPDQPNPLC